MLPGGRGYIKLCSIPISGPKIRLKRRIKWFSALLWDVPLPWKNNIVPLLITPLHNFLILVSTPGWEPMLYCLRSLQCFSTRVLPYTPASISIRVLDRPKAALCKTPLCWRGGEGTGGQREWSYQPKGVPAPRFSSWAVQRAAPWPNLCLGSAKGCKLECALLPQPILVWSHMLLLETEGCRTVPLACHPYVSGRSMWGWTGRRCRKNVDSRGSWCPICLHRRQAAQPSRGCTHIVAPLEGAHSTFTDLKEHLLNQRESHHNAII